jgi:hypothetical protein
MTTFESILWRGLVFPGHEFCRLFSQNSQWHVEGTAVFSHHQRPCQLDYQVICDAAWRTLSAKVEGWLSNSPVDLHINTDQDQGWWLNMVEQPAVKGCIDLDLNFSPATNLLPIRRLNLSIGETVEIRSAWLRFPSLKLEPLSQQYTRLDQDKYRYESAGGQFKADLRVNSSGLVVDYPGIWRSEASSE